MRERLVDMLMESHITAEDAATQLVSGEPLEESFWLSWGIPTSLFTVVMLGVAKKALNAQRARGEKAERDMWDEFEAALPNLHEYQWRLRKAAKDSAAKLRRDIPAMKADYVSSGGASGKSAQERRFRQIAYRYVADLDDLIDDVTDDIRNYSRWSKVAKAILAKYAPMTYYKKWYHVPFKRTKVLPPDLEKDYLEMIKIYVEALRELRGKALELRERLLEKTKELIGAAA